MCETTKDFKLCTCSTNKNVIIQHHKKSKRSKKLKEDNSLIGIKWTLYQYKGQHYSGMDGMVVAPSDKLTEVITAEHVKSELNKRNCFDFDYAPAEGDYLVLAFSLTVKEMREKEYTYLPFIYQSGKWTINSYNAFYEKIEEINKGYLNLDGG